MNKAKLIKKSEQQKADAPSAPESPRRSLQTTAKSVMQWVRENRESDARSPRERFAALFAQTQS